MSITTLTALRDEEKNRLTLIVDNSATRIADLRRMAAEAIGDLDNAHRAATRNTAIMFDNLIGFERDRMDAALAELGEPPADNPGRIATT